MTMGGTRWINRTSFTHRSSGGRCSASSQGHRGTTVQSPSLHPRLSHFHEWCSCQPIKFRPSQTTIAQQMHKKSRVLKILNWSHEMQTNYTKPGKTRILMFAIIRTVKLPANLNCIITTDGSGGRFCWVGGTNDLSAGKNNILTLPDHSNNGTWDNVINQSTEEGLCRQVLVVLLSKRTIHIDELHTWTYSAKNLA